jgi:hypothetical protein
MIAPEIRLTSEGDSKAVRLGANRPTTGSWILPFSDGTFQRLREYQPGAIDVNWLYVRNWVPDPFEDVAPIIDCVAWPKGSREPWWLWRNIAACVGEHELQSAWWENRPARLVETPADYLACHCAAFCILDWNADINAMLGAAPGVCCSTLRLAQKLSRTLQQQAMPKLSITVAMKEAA